ncbi:MAG: hypothetical protein HQK96_01655, partial [Nitrospirae bacterium]|nr:hypothetical protein [Nitrospirota bacterium]
MRESKNEGLSTMYMGRRRFIATVDSITKDKEHIVLADVYNADELVKVADSVTMNLTSGFRLTELGKKDIVEFQGRVEQRLSGYANPRFNIDNRVIEYYIARATLIKNLSAIN